MRMRRYLFLLFLFLLACGPVCSASEGPSLVLVLMDQVIPQELTGVNMNNLEQIQKNSAFGLINLREAESLQSGSTYLTAANGKKCKNSNQVHSGYNSGTGVINPDFDHLRELNGGDTGRFGTLLREAGLQSALLGNADTDYALRRTAVSLLMDDRGQIPLGDVSDSLVREVDRSPGYLTDWKALRGKVEKYLNSADVMVVETGDTSRIEDAAGRFTIPDYHREKKRALVAIDDFLGFIWEKIDPEETVMVVLSLSPSARDRERGHRLGWFLAAGRDIDSGWITTPTTRRKGLLTIGELLPFFVHSAGVEERFELEGESLQVVPERAGLEDLAEFEKGIASIYRLRIPYIRGFVVLQIILILFSVLLLYRNSFSGQGIIFFLSEYLLLALIFVPVNFIFLSRMIKAEIYPVQWLWHPVVGHGDTIYNLLFLFLLTAVEVFLLRMLTEGRLEKIIPAALFTVLLVTVDLVWGLGWISDSLLGSSSVIGARFYGLGNEYAGLFGGGVLIGITGIAEKWGGYRRCYLIPLFAGSLVVIGSSRLGANFGGFLSLLIALVFTWFYLGDYKFRANKIAAVIVLFIAAIALLGLVDYLELTGPSSHIGNAVRLLLKGDFRELLEIAVRKLRMNYRLFRWTIWTRVLLVFIIYLLILFRYPFDRLQKLFTIYPRLTAGFYGSLVGGVVAMFVNDSGIVSAATMLFFPVMTLLYLLLEGAGGISRGEDGYNSNE
ncbi:MAG: hypothetical protein ACOCQC_01600 [Halanaerobiaceae bacterium]